MILPDGSASPPSEVAGPFECSHRVFIFAPYGNDARLTAAVLNDARLETEVCQDIQEICSHSQEECGALLLAEESMSDHAVARLRQWLATQPSWSELPVIVVTGGGESSQSQHRFLKSLEGVGNVTFLERPFRRGTLLASVEMALRSRQRQYQVRELMDQTRRDAETLRQASRRKDEFLAMLAHELRNPLSSISHAALLLNGHGGNDEHTWAAGVVRRQTAQLSRLVDDLLDVSRVTQGKIVLRPQTFDLADILTSACEAAAPLFHSRGHNLQASYTPHQISLHADPARVEQILVNLLTNAAKYTPPHGHIRLTASLEDHHAVISVQDSGIGISRERIHEMFDLFTQGDRNASRSEGGLGVGLTIVKNLCELHHGSVEATSPGIDQGCTFTVRLPALPWQPAVPASAFEPPAVPSTELPSSAGSPAPHRLLVVDDNADSANGLARLLRRRGYLVDVVYDGESALAHALATPPAALLLDIGLPGIDGYETLRRLRLQAGSTRAAPVCIALTGYGQEEDFHRSRASGFDAHFIKPVDIASLLACLRQHQLG